MEYLRRKIRAWNVSKQGCKKLVALPSQIISASAGAKVTPLVIMLRDAEIVNGTGKGFTVPVYTDHPLFTVVSKQYHNQVATLDCILQVVAAVTVFAVENTSGVALVEASSRRVIEVVGCATFAGFDLLPGGPTNHCKFQDLLIGLVKKKLIGFHCGPVNLRIFRIKPNVPPATIRARFGADKVLGFADYFSHCFSF
jgi:hypothetical protein